MIGTSIPLVDRPEPDAARDAYSIEVVTDAGAFRDLEAEWNDAVDRASLSHPFLRHEWMRTWWGCFGSGGRLHIIIVRIGGRIAAIAPLMAESVWMCGIPVRRLRLMHNDHTPRADFIVAESPDQSYRAIWTALRQAKFGWDVLQLGQLAQQSPTLQAIRALAEADGCGLGVWQSDSAPYLELKGTWDQYLDGLTAKFRGNVRNRLSRLTRVGEPVLETLDDSAAILAARDDAFRLEASEWKQTAGTSVSADPVVHRFYSLLAERASASGWLRLLFLSVNGRRIGVAYGSRYANRLFLLKTGYDPDFAQYSPFKLLTYFAVREAFREGLDEVDFLGDAEPWKLEWTPTTRPHDWLYVFANSNRGRLLRRAKFQVLPALKEWGA